MTKPRSPIILSAGSCVDVENDWRLHLVAADKVLGGIFIVNGHDYFRDGRPLTSGAPRILSIAAR